MGEAPRRVGGYIGRWSAFALPKKKVARISTSLLLFFKGVPSPSRNRK